MNAVRDSDSVVDFEKEIESLVAIAKADFEERAQAILKMAYIPLDAVPTLAFSDAVKNSEYVFVPLGWVTILREGYKMFRTSLSVTHETPAAYKILITKTEFDVEYLMGERYETVYGTTTSYLWLPKSQITIGRAFGLPFIRIPSWLAKKYPILLRLATRALEDLAGVDA
jgi:hypothetical protein